MADFYQIINLAQDREKIVSQRIAFDKRLTINFTDVNQIITEPQSFLDDARRDLGRLFADVKHDLRWRLTVCATNQKVVFQHSPRHIVVFTLDFQMQYAPIGQASDEIGTSHLD